MGPQRSSKLQKQKTNMRPPNGPFDGSPTMGPPHVSCGSPVSIAKRKSHSETGAS